MSTLIRVEPGFNPDHDSGLSDPCERVDCGHTKALHDKCGVMPREMAMTTWLHCSCNRTHKADGDMLCIHLPANSFICSV